MTARILSGKGIAEAIKSEVAKDVASLDRPPCLVVVRVGEDPASEVYVNSKVKTAAELAIVSRHEHLGIETTHRELLQVVHGLNADDSVDGILVQLPLPKQINEGEIIGAIDPEKDVDGFHPINVGKLSTGHAALVPCTPAGVIEILKRSDIQLAGRHAVIVGRSNIVGKPLAMLLLQENATVTVCHSKTVDLGSITRQADILIAAIGRAGFIGEEHICVGSTVIDVGINRVTEENELRQFFDGDELDKRLKTLQTKGSTLVGDVNPKAAMAAAANFTPVPGGVGLLTVAMLMKNTVTAARNRRMNHTGTETQRN